MMLKKSNDNIVKQAADRRLSELSLYYFFLLTIENIYSNIEFINNWHYREICNVLQNEVERMLRGEKTEKDLLINLPIRSGKTILISEIFPVWLWIKNSSLAVQNVCATQRLATKSSRMSKLIIESDWFQSLFPEIQLAQDNKSKSDYSTNNMGTRMSFGINSSIIGTGYDVLIIDDPNDPADSNSELALRNVRETFQDVIVGRQNNDTGIKIILQQRTNENDLCGYLLKNNSTDYRHICITAVVNKVTSREFLKFYDEDDLFFPKRYGIERLAKYERDLSGQAYASQLLQLPSALEGTILLRNWFKIMKQSAYQKYYHHTKYLFVDGAYTEKVDNDPCAFMVVSEINGRLYILKSYSKHLEFYEQLEEIKELVAQYNIKQVFIEKKATGDSIKQQLKRELKGVVVRGVNSGKDSKQDRARAIQIPLMNERVIVVEDLWNETFLSQCAAFPYGSHDDEVDCLVYAVLILISKKKITDVEDVKATSTQQDYPHDDFDLYSQY